jgi:hypothetical protein
VATKAAKGVLIPMKYIFFHSATACFQQMLCSLDIAMWFRLIMLPFGASDCKCVSAIFTQDVIIRPCHSETYGLVAYRRHESGVPRADVAI